MAKFLEFLDRHTARNLFRSSHLKVKCGRSGMEGALGTMIAMGPSYVTVNHFFN